MIITYAYFRDINGIPDGVEDVFLKKTIIRAESQLKFLIGKDFYNQLYAQYTAQVDESGLSTDNTAFYDPYVKEFIAKEGYVHYCANRNLIDTRAGFRSLTEEHSTASVDKNIAEKIKLEKQEAIEYTGRMINFLLTEKKKDSTKYPLYDSRYSSKMGTSFHITSISKDDDVYIKINQQRNNYGTN